MRKAYLIRIHLGVYSAFKRLCDAESQNNVPIKIDMGPISEHHLRTKDCPKDEQAALDLGAFYVVFYYT